MLFRNMINDTKHFFFWPAFNYFIVKNFAFIGVPEVLSITKHQWSYLMLNTKKDSQTSSRTTIPDEKELFFH